MYHSKCLAILAVAAAMALLPRGGARSIELSEMINKTVCAIEVQYDVNPDRIPRQIKMLTCASKTDQGCVANNIHRHCCHHENKMECVEMRDTVLVYDKKAKKSQVIEVSVGCACMVHDLSKAQSVADQPDR